MEIRNDSKCRGKFGSRKPGTNALGQSDYILIGQEIPHGPQIQNQQMSIQTVTKNEKLKRNFHKMINEEQKVLTCVGKRHRISQTNK